MARCDEGYLCDVCGKEVSGLPQSDLYLRYVIGMVDPERLHLAPERHVCCNPALAQFITDDDFLKRHASSLTSLPDGMAKADLDPAFVAERERLVTAGYQRLKELAASKQRPPIEEYPLVFGSADG
jgi:hypothetical protein